MTIPASLALWDLEHDDPVTCNCPFGAYAGSHRWDCAIYRGTAHDDVAPWRETFPVDLDEPPP